MESKILYLQHGKCLTLNKFIFKISKNRQKINTIKQLENVT